MQFSSASIVFIAALDSSEFRGACESHLYCNLMQIGLVFGQLCLAGGKVQLNISSTGKCGSQVTYGGGNGGGIEVTYGLVITNPISSSPNL